MPVYDFRSRHALVVDAPAARVAAAAEGFGLDRSWVARLLFRLRGLGPPPATLRASFATEGFTLLAEQPGREIVLGTAGRFWAIDERAAMVHPRDAEAFAAYREPGSAKAVLAVRIDALPDGRTRLSTETRVACTDTAAWIRFAAYWTVIKPFSGLIRRAMLRGIAERATRADPA